MNVYDEIVKDYPYSAFKFVSAANPQPDAMGGSSAVSQRTRTNSVTNPNFETDVAGWSAYTGVATPTRSTVSPFSGTGRLQAVGNSSSTAPRVQYIFPSGLVAGDIWTLSGRVRMDGTFPTGAIPYVAIRWQTTTGESVAVPAPIFTPDGSGYMRISITSTVPATTNGSAVLSFGFSGLASVLTAAGSFGLDEVLWEKTGTLRNYFDGSTSGASWSGVANASTSTLIEPVPISDLSMVSGPTKSLLVGSDFVLRFGMPERFSKEYTNYPFSIESWVGFDTTGQFPIMSHVSSVDGLYFDGNYLIFSVDLDGGGSVSAKWPTPDFTKNYHVVGVYNTQKVMLYVDGALAAKTDMPLGAVIALKTDKNLYSGLAASQQTMRFEAPAIYYKELSADRIAAHYAAGRLVMNTLDAVGMFGGALWKFSDERRDIMYAKDVVWNSDGLIDNVMATDTLEPSYDSTDLSIAGTYTIAIPVSDTLTASPPLPQGMKVEWDGDGTFTVQYSIDNGTTWTTAVNGQIQATTVGMAATVVPQIKIAFPAGAARGVNVVRDMRVTVYRTATSYSVNSNERTVTLNASTPTSTTWSEPIETDNAVGTNVGLTNTYTLNESVETDITNVGTIEFWTEFAGPSLGYYLLDSRSVTPSNASYIWVTATGQLNWAGFSAVYVNGISVPNTTFVPVPGRPYHIVGVYTAPHNAKIRVQSGISGNTDQIAMMTIYPGSLTAAQVLTLFKAYFGYPVLAAEDTNMITVLETAPASKAYVADWSIQGAG